jgi:hypothetical protein
MPIIEKRTVTVFTNEIPGIDCIKYVDACHAYGEMWVYAQWQVDEVDAFNGLDPRFDTLTDEQQSLIWQIAEAHQLTQHEGDDE